MSNKMLALMMGFVAFLILAVGLVFVLALSGGGDDDNGATATDLTGRTWEQVRVTDLEVGDVVSLGDLDAVEVVHVAGWGFDEFNGDRVFGIAVLDDGIERVLDLSDEEALLRLT